MRVYRDNIKMTIPSPLHPVRQVNTGGLCDPDHLDTLLILPTLVRLDLLDGPLDIIFPGLGCPFRLRRIEPDLIITPTGLGPTAPTTSLALEPVFSK